MTQKFQIYKCEICGNLIQVLLEGNGELVCCGKNMILQAIQHDTNELGEKHAPKYEQRNDETFVTVKSHPMVNEHYIQFIETYTKDKNEMHIKYFYPQETAEMNISHFTKEVESIEFCNIHRLWGE